MSTLNLGWEERINVLAAYLDQLHEHYENMDIERRIAVDCAFKAAVKALQENGIHKSDCAMDDRAEELVAAIAYYVRRSSVL